MLLTPLARSFENVLKENRSHSVTALLQQSARRISHLIQRVAKLESPNEMIR
jgi:hypothetical protein